MTATIPASAPTAFEKARDRLADALKACDRGSLRDAIAAVAEARLILETEEVFRDARKGQA